MLELHIPSVDASNGNIPVSWCISKDLMSKLANRGIKDPSIIICIVPQKHKDGEVNHNREYRKVARLQDLMTYVELPFAGKNKMYAIVSDLPLKEAKERWLRRYGSDWYNLILNYHKDDYEDLPDVDNEYTASPLTIEVPNAIFAKEPSDWEKAWIGWMSNTKPTNQCEFRRQKLLAYTIQPIIFLCLYSIQILFSVAALLYGARGLSIKPLLHPLSYHPVEKTFELFSKGTVFINSDSDSDYESFFQKFKFLPFMPISLIGMASIILGGHTIHMYVLVAFSLFVILAALGFIVRYISYRKRLEEEKAIPWYLDAEECQLLTCNDRQKPMTINQLPAKHRTLKIRFEAFKAAVCRPYSR